MSNPVSALTELVVAVAAGVEPTVPTYLDMLATGDPFLDQLNELSYVNIRSLPAFAKALDALKKDPDLAILATKPGEPGAFVMSRGGGARMDFESMVTALVTTGLRQLFVNETPVSDTALARAVLENYEEFKRSTRGEPVRAYDVRGLAGLTLGPGLQIATPWGVIRGVEATPQPNFGLRRGLQGPMTTAVLVTTSLTPVSISLEASPEMPMWDQQYVEDITKFRTLTSLLFAMASNDEDRCAPVMTFETTLVPFSSGNGWSSSIITTNPFMQQVEFKQGQVKEIEKLAITLNEKYHSSLQTASVRIVSAIAQRLDKADSLIDAVTAWESLVGTRTETVYRVTASLANLLEADATKRTAFRKRLGGVYDIRSRVVHGDVVDPQDVIDASDQAISVALQAMRELYKREGDWLSMKSSQRSERLLLGF